MFVDTDCIGIFGMRGMGKTTMSRRIQEFFPTKFIFDTINDYNDCKNVVHNYDELAQFVLDTQDQSGFTCVIKFPVSRDSNIEYFDACNELLFHRGNCFIVYEELHVYANAHYCPPYMRHIALLGRHENIGFAFTTQRIAEVNKTILTQTHHRFAGYVDNPNDLKTLKEWGYNQAELDQLEKYEFLWRNQREVIKVDNYLNFK